MHRIIAAVLIVFGTVSVAVAAEGEGAGEMETWAPANAWDVGQWIKNAASSVMKIITKAISETATAITDFFKSIWDSAKLLFVTIFDFFKSCWAKILELYEFCIDGVKWGWEVFCKMLEDYWASFQELVDWIGETLWELIFTTVDKMIGLFHDFVMWILDEIPEIKEPPGWENGFDTIFNIGMTVNRFVPAVEALILWGCYLATAGVILVYRLIHSWLW